MTPNTSRQIALTSESENGLDVHPGEGDASRISGNRPVAPEGLDQQARKRQLDVAFGAGVESESDRTGSREVGVRAAVVRGVVEEDLSGHVSGHVEAVREANSSRAVPLGLGQ